MHNEIERLLLLIEAEIKFLRVVWEKCQDGSSSYGEIEKQCEKSCAAVYRLQNFILDHKEWVSLASGIK